MSINIIKKLPIGVIIENGEGVTYFYDKNKNEMIKVVLNVNSDESNITQFKNFNHFLNTIQNKDEKEINNILSNKNSWENIEKCFFKNFKKITEPTLFFLILKNKIFGEINRKTKKKLKLKVNKYTKKELKEKLLLIIDSF